jgi:ssDNA-binding Zn-finger/Zn-ribbon topoisomerase 1
MVIVDLVHGPGNSGGRLFQDEDGERLLTVALSRAEGKLIVVGDRDMPTTGLSRRTVDVLNSIRRLRTVGPSRPWRQERPNGFAIEIAPGLPAAGNVSAEELVAAWLPKALPERLRHLDGPHAQIGPAGHAVWVSNAGVVGLHSFTMQTIGTFVVTRAPRFADALSDALSGMPLTRGAAQTPAGVRAPRAARHDSCARCDGHVLPTRASRYSVELECSSCQNTRRATPRELQAWLQAVGPRCPSCRAALALRSSEYGKFFGCTRYPDCDSTLNLDALCDAALNPDPPPAVERTISKRSKRELSVDEVACPSCHLLKPVRLFPKDSTVCVDCR